MTDYKKLKNRCSNCGHRLSMGVNKSCTVVTNEMGHNHPAADKKCLCNKHE